MAWIGARYEFASTFSYRIPYFSSSYALSAPVPSPSTIKLAMVGATINRTGDIEKGRRLFGKISNANIMIELPNKIVAFRTLMKRLKKRRQEEGFDNTFGIREYVIYDGTLGIHLNVSPEDLEEVSEALQRIQYFGTSDSICYCLEKTKTGPDQKQIIRPCLQEQTLRGTIFLLSDFPEKITFDEVNPLSGKKMKKDSISLKPYLFPIRAVQKDRNCTIYEHI